MKDMIKAIKELSYRHNTSKVYSDFVEVSAIALSNAVDKTNYAEREQRYLDIVGQYTKEEFHTFPQLLGMIIKHLDASPKDVLGDVFHELELHNERKRQFFTPYPICQMMAKIVIGDNPQSIIDKNGFITVSEPSCGTGAMVIATAHELLSQGINYQQSVHVTAIDLDATCVHAAYVQFSLLYIPATLIHGDSLSLKIYNLWYTPAHVLGFWEQKMKGSENLRTIKEFISCSPVKEVTNVGLDNSDIISKHQKNSKNLGTQLSIF